MFENNATLPKKKKINALLITIIVLGLMLCLCGFIVSLLPDSKNSSSTGGHELTTSTIVKKSESTLPSNVHGTENAATLTVYSTPTIIFQVSFISNGNVRTGPGLNFSVVRVMRTGEIAQVYGRSEDGTWLWIDPVEQLWVHTSVVESSVSIEDLPLAPTPLPSITPSLIPTFTPSPSASPVPPISLTQVYENLEKMTELQFSEYKNFIVGKPVQEIVTISNVEDDGRVSLSGPWSPFIFNVSDFGVVIVGVPRDIAIELNAGDEVLLEATIDRIVGNYNYFSNRENVLVLTYKDIQIP